MAQPMGVLKVIRLTGKMCVERGLQVGAVLVMDTIEPFRHRTDAAGGRQAKHRAPSARAVELLTPNIQLPQPVVGAFRGECEPLLVSPQRVFGARALGHVLPEQRHAAGNRQYFDLERSRPRRRREGKMRERLPGPRSEERRVGKDCSTGWVV